MYSGMMVGVMVLMIILDGCTWCRYISQTCSTSLNKLSTSLNNNLSTITPHPHTTQPTPHTANDYKYSPGVCFLTTMILWGPWGAPWNVPRVWHQKWARGALGAQGMHPPITNTLWNHHQACLVVGCRPRTTCACSLHRWGCCCAMACLSTHTRCMNTS